MEIEFSIEAHQQLLEWKRLGNKLVQNKITQLLESIIQDPFTGIGKPEALKHKWSGYWSRRITKEHRMIYKVENNRIFIAQLKFHY